MIKLPCEQIVSKITQKTGKSSAEIDERIKQKMDQLAGLISREGAAHIVANELGVNAFEDFMGKIKLNKLIAGMSNVEAVGKVTALYGVREFSTAKGNGKVGSFMIADETGNTRITCWQAMTDKMATIKEGDIVRLKNAYTKENNGRIELHMNEKAEMELNPPGETITVTNTSAAPEMRADAQRKKISELSEADSNIEILGTVVQVFEPRFFEVCPQCNKRVKQKDGQFSCEQHGNTTPDYSFVVNATLDDGSETIRGVFFREQAEKLIGKPRQEIIQYREFKEKFDQIKVELLGQMTKITGRITKNAMFDRLEIVARNVSMNPDPKDEIARLNKQLGNEITV